MDAINGRRRFWLSGLHCLQAALQAIGKPGTYSCLTSVSKSNCKLGVDVAGTDNFGHVTQFCFLQGQAAGHPKR